MNTQEVAQKVSDDLRRRGRAQDRAQTTQEVSQRALDDLRRRGWAQGAGSGVCILMAAMAVPAFRPLKHRWMIEVGALLPPGHTNLIHYNDDPHTTFEDIELLLKRHAHGDQP